MFYGNTYLQQVLSKNATGLVQPLTAISNFSPLIYRWANGNCLSVTPSGSFAKGTAVKCSADVDLFISLNPNTKEDLRTIYNGLHQYLTNLNYTVRKQNVSIRVNYNGNSVDLVPAKRQTLLTADHSLYVSKRDTWQKTNVDIHINLVKTSGRAEVIKLTKIWRECHRLDFPSLHLEMAVIRALNGNYSYDLETLFKAALGWISKNIQNARFEDPANTNNPISEDITAKAKEAIALRAALAVVSTDWSKVVW